jgi:hypothetical protein
LHILAYVRGRRQRVSDKERERETKETTTLRECGISEAYLYIPVQVQKFSSLSRQFEKPPLVLKSPENEVTDAFNAFLAMLSRNINLTIYQNIENSKIHFTFV